MDPSEAGAAFWLLDSDLHYLNHGSYGACPQPVLEQQQRLRNQLELQPVDFFSRQLPGLLDAARSELGIFVGADPAELVFVPNATTGVNTVLRSLPLQPGDELLTTNHAYNACRNALNFVGDRTGARIVVAEVPFPIATPAAAIAAILQRVSSRTKLALLDHVTSPTGLILPIADIVALLAQQGIETLVDGAHAPGMLPLNLQAIGATYYTGNCHKWICAPKGAAFLYVQRAKQFQIRPLTISHGANAPRQDRSRFHLEFDWTGTDDPTPYLCIPTAIACLGKLLPGGWPELMQRHRSMVLAAQQLLSEVLEIAPPCPAAMIGALAALPLPEGDSLPLYQQLLEQFRLEVPVFPWPAPPQRLLRISAFFYNQFSEYQLLAQALGELLRPGT